MYTHTVRNTLIETLSKKEEPTLTHFDDEDIPLYLNRYTLVPHPDTFEFFHLLESELERDASISTILDVGTGSGVIALLLSRALKKTLYGSDISEQALTIAKKNAHELGLPVTFLQNHDGEWLSELKNIETSIDCIVSNPPFVGTREYDSPLFHERFPLVQHEPRNAIVTHDEQGIEPYVEIAKKGFSYGIRYYYFILNAENSNSIVKALQQELPRHTTRIIKNSINEPRFLFLHIL